MTANSRTLHWIAVGDSQLSAIHAFAGSFDDVELRTYDDVQSVPDTAESVGVALAVGPGQAAAVERMLAVPAVVDARVEIPGVDAQRGDVAAAIRSSGWAVEALWPSGRGTWLAHLRRPLADDAVLPHIVDEECPPAPDAKGWPGPGAEQSVKEKRATNPGRTRPSRHRSSAATRRARRRKVVFAAIAIAAVTLIVTAVAVLAGYVFGRYGTRSHAIVALVLSGVAIQASTLVGVVYVARHARHTRLHRDQVDARFNRRLQALARRSAETREDVKRHQQVVQNTVDGVGRAVEAVSVQGSRALAQLQETTRSSQRALAQQVQALGQLDRLVPLLSPTPPLGGWVASPDLVLLLVERLLVQRPSLVVECGSGVTTLFLAAAAEQRGFTCRIVSLEQDPAVAERTRAVLAAHGVAHRAEVRCIPFEDVGVPDDGAPRALTAAVQDLHEIGLLFVDGPGASAVQGRFPALPLLRDRLAEDAVVVIDDLIRVGDARTAGRWADLFPDFCLQVRTDLEKHAGVLTRTS